MASFLDMQIPPRTLTQNVNFQYEVPNEYGTPVVYFPDNLTRDNPPSYLGMNEPSVVPALPVSPRYRPNVNLPPVITARDQANYDLYRARERALFELLDTEARRRRGEWIPLEEDYGSTDIPYSQPFDDRENYLRNTVQSEFNPLYLGPYYPYVTSYR